MGNSMEFRDFVYCIDSPWAWGVVLLISLRAIYTCAKEKDFVHLAAFLAVAMGASYMLGAALGFFQMPSVFK